LPIYARPDAWEEYDAAMRFDVERRLHDRGITNTQKCELNEPTLRVAGENLELIAEKFLELRRQE
jgi:hypothetical protein